jgi:hypothetical protein
VTVVAAANQSVLECKPCSATVTGAVGADVINYTPATSQGSRRNYPIAVTLGTNP